MIAGFDPTHVGGGYGVRIGMSYMVIPSSPTPAYLRPLAQLVQSEYFSFC